MSLRITREPSGDATHAHGGRHLKLLLAVLGLALAGRLVAVDALPVVFDEVCVMAYGVTRALAGPPLGWLFEVPVAVSNGVTPLWLWVQAGPMACFGPTSKLGLRLVPVLLGLLTVGLTFRLAGRYHGPRAAVYGGTLAAVASPYLFASARGEYSESLLVPLVLLLYADLRQARGGAPPPRAAFWVALALLTYLGKGALVWGGYTLALGLFWLLGRVRPADPSATPPLGWRPAVWLVTAPLLPTIAWMLLAQQTLFGNGQRLDTDLGPVGDVWTNGLRLTVGYGTDVQRFMVAGPREALFVYRSFAAWPTLALVAVPALLALVVACRDLGRGLRRSDRVGSAGAVTFLALVLVPLAALLAKGALDVRFHLLYLPVLLVHVAGALDGWCRLGEERRVAAFCAFGRVTWGYVLWTMGSAPAVDPAARRLWWALGVALLVAALVQVSGLELGGRPAARPAALGMVGAYLAFAAFSGLTNGPMDWGRRWAWEPGPLEQDAPRETSAFPHPTLQLARCCLARGDLQAGRRQMTRVLESPELDPGSRLEAARWLIEGGGPEAQRALFLMRDHVQRHPGDLEARALLERATRVPAPEPRR